MHPDDTKRLAARATIYSLLADAYRSPADLSSETVDQLAAALEAVGGRPAALSTDLTQAYGDAAGQTLAVDHARLFVGPFMVPAPPYGSVYLEGKRRIMGDSSMDARNQYRSAGFDLASDFHRPPDHVCVELEFMHALVCLQIQAACDGDLEAEADSRNRQHRFLLEHLGAWGPRFAELAGRHAETEFYRQLAQVTAAFLEDETRMAAAHTQASQACPA